MITALALISAMAADAAPRLLVFSKTTGFRHDAIPVARQAILEIALENEWSATFTEDAGWFEESRLSTYKGIVFMLTTGDVLNDTQQAAMQKFIERGGGYVGIHAASDTEYDWPWYGKLVGAYFKSHPAIQTAIVAIEDQKHPSTSFLPRFWSRKDEWYDFRSNPRPDVQVLATVDESTYKGGQMGKDHPIMWCREVGKGRSWYTAMGHTKESYTEKPFRRMLGEGIRWSIRD